MGAPIGNRNAAGTHRRYGTGARSTKALLRLRSKSLYSGRKEIIKSGTGKSRTFNVWGKNLNQMARLSNSQVKTLRKHGWGWAP